MIKPFEFFSAGRIVFGRGTIARLADVVESSSRVLVVYNGSDSLPQRIAELLKRPTTHFRQRGEPTMTDVDAALVTARDAACNFVIAIGGGSAIDAGKAVAGLLANGGVASDYMEVVGKGEKIKKPAVPWIAIPTTAGTGAEVTRNAVIGWPEKKFKASIRSELLLPRVALIDPELGVDVPRDVTARSGMDALCQCIEAYVSNGATPMTDLVAIRGLELAGRFLRRAYDDGHDIDAREGMALAAVFSGIALTNAGLGAAHGFAAPLGANFPAPHGTVCGVLLPHVIRANRSRGVDKYADIDRVLGGDAEQICSELTMHLKLPALGAFEVRGEDVPAMVDLAKRASSMRYNPVVLDDAMLTRILTDAL